MSQGVITLGKSHKPPEQSISKDSVDNTEDIQNLKRRLINFKYAPVV